MANTLHHIELRAGETVRIGDSMVTLTHKSGQRARLAICADPKTLIVRPGRINTGAQECASSPEEAANGKHPV